MLSISADKIDSLFELIGSKQPLYLPVDNNSGKADFKKWEKGVKLSSALKTSSSQKLNIWFHTRFLEKKLK